MVLSRCPSCGSRRVKYVISDYIVKLSKWHRIVVPALRRLQCMNCKGRFFDAEAMAVKSHYLSKHPAWQSRRRALFQRIASKRRLAA